jgi:serine/threonine protein kinase
VTKPIPFGKYSLLDRIAAGGMAEVFRAKAYGVEGFERVVAVKRILPSIAADTDFITMFIDEAKIAVQLNHANIAQIFDLGKAGNSYFIALEYVHGLDVRSIFDALAKRGQRAPVTMAAYVAMKICEGLDYAHHRRDASGRPLELVHRDVSPQNMLISFDGDVKLIDFGIAKAAGKEGRTRAGILKGKFGYLSPEQVISNQVDARSDIFGVGIVLHELLTGRRLFVGDNEFSTIEKVRAADVTPPHYLNPEVDEELSRVVMKALVRDPAHRYQSAAALQEDLQRFLREQDEPFARRELSAFMRLNFPEHAADDQEAVGDLQGVQVPLADATDVTPIVREAESKAVIDETREIPNEGSSKHSSTLLGMPVVARQAPGRSVPPPPPRSGGAPSRPPSPGRSVPPPPPAPPGRGRTAPPAASTQPPPLPRSQPPVSAAAAPVASLGSQPPVSGTRSHLGSRPPVSAPTPVRPPSYAPAPVEDSSVADDDDYANELASDFGQPTPIHHYAQPMNLHTAQTAPTAIPSVVGPAPSSPPASRSLPPPPMSTDEEPTSFRPGSVPPVIATKNPVLDMDWDDEELSTQIYDRPEDQVDPAYAGYVPGQDYGQQPQHGYDPNAYDAQAYSQSYAQHGYPQPGQADYQGVGFTQPGYPPPDYAAAQAAAAGQAQAPAYNDYGSPYTAPYNGGQQAAVPTFVPPPADMQAYQASYGQPVPGSASQGRAMQATQQMLTHPPEKSRSAFYAMAVAGFILVCFLGYVFLSKTEPGVVQLTTHPADATVSFDGKQVGTSSPFLVTGVVPGDKHLLEVKKDGYRAWSQEVQVQPGQTLQFPVTLEPNSGAGAVAAAGQPGAPTGSFTLESNPPGAKVLLDGQELGGVTPLRIGNLVAKSYSIKLELADYRPQTLNVDVKSGQDQTLSRVVLQPLRVRVRIVSEPSGADVSVARGSDRRALGRSPVDVTLENDGAPWAVEVSKSGFEKFEQAIALDSGERDVTVRANLVRQSGGAPTPTPPVAREPVARAEPREPPRAREPVARPEPRVPVAKPEPVASSGGGTGTLRINSRPWSQVVIDGRPIGSTPQMNVSLSEGTHKVTLINPEFDIKKTLTVKIKAGQVETQIVALQ